ncbi:MAG TPA: PfkB family carbohydrate kinase [Candidatus Krumholzibacteria bacterium]|nr:PfkB family carbohydrate kinase [Candidatus Krumholzibacteria bacterium]
MIDRFQDLLDAFTTRRIAVVGDFLLDQYMLGTTARVSREAPIVVVDYQETVNHPGGAANAAQNVTALGGTAVAVGVLGADREADALVTLLRERGVDTNGLLALARATTSLKLRIMAGEMNAQKQQVARVDRSHRIELDAAARAALVEAVESAGGSCDAVLLADYGLGVLGEDVSARAIDVARARGVPVVVDSRYRAFAFRGATVATPNEVEAMAALGLEREGDLMDGERLRRSLAQTGLASLIVTRGSKGMVVCDEGGKVSTIGIAGTHQATDVTGAGDTVSAVVALSLSAGASLEEAARMATFAASIVVMKRGTATASPAEMRTVIESERRANA